MGAPFPPSSLLPPFLPFQVGIQVASEDLCSEKQWTVCKALATFVAHRELSKVGRYTWVLVMAGRDWGCEAGGWQRHGGGGTSGSSERKLPTAVARPQASSLAPLPHLSLCVSHGSLQISPFPYVCYRTSHPLHPLYLC